MCEGTFPSAWNLAASITENIGEAAAWRVIGADDPLTLTDIRIPLLRFACGCGHLLNHAG
jgi:hypothetical protein